MTPYLPELFTKYNIPWSNRRGQGPTWDGSDLDISNATDKAWETHEIAHCLTTEHLSLPNYGLGIDPGGGSYTKRILTLEVADFEENKALIGGVLLLIAFGSTELEIIHHIKDYNIFNVDEIEYEKAYDSLPCFLQELVSFSVLRDYIYFKTKHTEA